MRPVMRLPLREAKFVCLSCKSQVAPRVSPLSQFRRYASDSPGVLERTRRMLWGTENPPGPEDPYSGSQIMSSPKAEESEPVEEDFNLAQQRDTSATDEVEIPDWKTMPRIGYLKESEWKLKGFSSSKDAVRRWSHGRWSNPRWNKTKFPMPIDKATRQAAVEIGLTQILQELSMSGLMIPRKLINQCRVHGDAEKWCDRLRFPGKVDVVCMFRNTNKTDGPPMREEQWTRLRQVFESQPIETKAQETLGTLSLANGTTKFAFFARLYKLMDERIPEAIVASSFDIANVISEYKSFLERTTKSTPQNLREKMTKNRLPQLANVKVSDFRQTPSDNDESLGRKKAIVTALFESGLVNRPSLPSGVHPMQRGAKKHLKKKIT